MVTGLDYVTYTRQRAEEGTQLNFAGYLSEIPGRITQSTAGAEPAPPPTLASALPDALEGWRITPYDPADFDRMARVTPREKTELDIRQEELNALLEADPGFQQIQAEQARHVEEERITLTRGNDIMILTLTFRSAKMYEGLTGGILSAVQDNMMDTVTFMDDPFATVRGVPFRVSPIDDSPDGRRFRGHMGRQIDILVQTNADDSAVMNLLSGVGFATLNGMLMAPLETVDTSLPGFTPAATPAPQPATAEAPEAAATPAEPEPPAAPAVRRPGDKNSNCRVENGVRRCTVSGN